MQYSWLWPLLACLWIYAQGDDDNSSSTTTTLNIGDLMAQTLLSDESRSSGNESRGESTTTTTVAPGTSFSYGGGTFTRGQYFTFTGSAHASPADYRFSGVATTLNSPIGAGDTSIDVATTAGFSIGDTLLIAEMEIKQIVGFSSINLNSAMGQAHAAGASVVAVTYAGVAGSTAGDPVSWYGNLRTEYHLPLHTEVLLFETRDYQVFGQAFEGLGADQWIRQVTVKNNGGKNTIVDIGIKDLTRWSRNGTAPNEFDTLQVILWNSRSYLRVFPPPDAYLNRDQLTILFTRQDLAEHARSRHYEMPRRECVLVASPAAKVAICSSSAHEWYGELGLGAFKYAHLDLEFFDLQKEESYAGVLPEFWSLAPMSNTTRSFIVSESGDPPPEGSGTRATVDTTEEFPKALLAGLKGSSTVI